MSRWFEMARLCEIANYFMLSIVLQCQILAEHASVANPLMS